VLYSFHMIIGCVRVAKTYTALVEVYQQSMYSCNFSNYVITFSLCLGAHAQTRAYGSLVVCLSVCLSVTGISVPLVKFKS